MNPVTPISATLLPTNFAECKNDPIYKLACQLFSGSQTNKAWAIHFFIQSAEKNNVLSMFKLSNILSNQTEGFTWTQKAAELGFPPAQYNLAVRFETGIGVAQDPENAKKWYFKAIRAGVAPKTEDQPSALFREVFKSLQTPIISTTPQPISPTIVPTSSIKRSIATMQDGSEIPQKSQGKAKRQRRTHPNNQRKKQSLAVKASTTTSTLPVNTTPRKEQTPSVQQSSIAPSVITTAPVRNYLKIQIKPDTPVVEKTVAQAKNLYYGSSQIKQNIPEALKLFEAAAKPPFESVYAKLMIAKHHLKNEQYDLAFQILNAIHLNIPEALYLFSLLSERTNSVEKETIKTYYGSAIREGFKPTRYPMKTLLYEVCQREFEEEQAGKQFPALVPTPKGQNIVSLGKVTLESELDNLEKALKIFEVAAKPPHDNDEAKLFVGKIYLKLYDEDQALTWLERSEQPEALFIMATLKEKKAKTADEIDEVSMLYRSSILYGFVPNKDQERTQLYRSIEKEFFSETQTSN